MRLTHLSPLFLTLLFLSGGLQGCAGARVRAAYEDSLTEALTLTREVRPASQAGQPPFQAAIFVRSSLFDTLLEEKLAGELIDDVKLEAIQEEANNQLEKVKAMGPIARRLVGRFEEVRGSGSLELKPSLRMRSVKTEMDARCDGCIRLEATLDGGLEGTAGTVVSLQGRVSLLGKMEAISLKDGPGLKLSVERLEAVHLQMPGGQASGGQGARGSLVGRLEQQLEQQIGDRLKAHPEQATVTIPLAERLSQGKGVRIEGVGLHSSPGPQGGLFIGLNTTLNAPGGLPLPEVMPSGDYDIAFALSDQVLTHLARAALASGKVPSRYDRKGHADSEGKMALELRALRFVEGGFELDTRFYYLGWPAWWRNYTLAGTIQVSQGHLEPIITGIRKGEGDGALWLSSLASRRLKSDELLSKLGQQVPDKMPLETVDGLKERLLPISVGTRPGVMMVFGRLDTSPEGGAAR